jgi:hypothetical protein
LPSDYKVDASALLGRPFYVGNVEWPTSVDRRNVLELPINDLPRDVFRSNKTLYNAIKMASLGRASMELTISLSGTIGHSGCILFGVVPPVPSYPRDDATQLINTLMSGPHGFLFANESTNITIPVPFYCNTDFGSLDVELDSIASAVDIHYRNCSYATLVAIVINPLLASEGSTNSLPINIEAKFNELEMYVPAPRYLDWEPPLNLVNSFKISLKDDDTEFKPEAGIIAAAAPVMEMAATTALGALATKTATSVVSVIGDFYDGARKKVRKWLGLHNPNVPVVENRVLVSEMNFKHQVDVPQRFEKLDPYAKVDRIVKGPIYNTTIDEMDVTNILSKRQYVGTFKVLAGDGAGKILWARPISPQQGPLPGLRGFANNITLLHSMARAWRGDIEITIQSSMNNKQHCKLRMFRYMQPAVQALTFVPTYASLANAPSTLLEFSQGGIEHTVKLDYLARNDLVQSTEDINMEGLMHGIYYVYLATPLVSADGSPEEAEFNVYISCPNVQLFGYTTKRLIAERNNAFFDTEGRFRAESSFAPNSESGFNPQICRDDANFKNEGNDDTHNSRLVRISDMRQLVRRMYTTYPWTGYIVGPNAKSAISLPLGPFVGHGSTETRREQVTSPIRLIGGMYYGKNVGFKIRLEVRLPALYDDPPSKYFAVQAYYAPQNSYIALNNLTVNHGGTYTKAGINQESISGVTVPMADSYYTPLLDCSNVQVHDNYYLCEFVIPETHLYQYLGGPSVYRLDDEASVSFIASDLSVEDFGTLILIFNNYGTSDLVVNYTLSVGLTDESRMGIAALAPAFKLNNPTVYKGGINGLTEPDLVGTTAAYYSRV